jgi:hypothetical protein
MSLDDLNERVKSFHEHFARGYVWVVRPDHRQLQLGGGSSKLTK